MNCYICQAEAVTRCFACGQLVCEVHAGSKQCAHCNTGITSLDPRAVRAGARANPTQPNHHGWWRPQQAEEYQPPACYECKGLARAICHNCRCHYCRDHAGPNGLCEACGRSAWLGVYVFLGVLGMMLLLLVFTKLFG